MTSNQATFGTPLKNDSGVVPSNHFLMDLNMEPTDYLSCLENYENFNFYDLSSNMFPSNPLPSSFSLCSDHPVLEPLPLDIFDMSSVSNHSMIPNEMSTAFKETTSLPNLNTTPTDLLHLSAPSILPKTDTFTKKEDIFVPTPSSFTRPLLTSDSNLTHSFSQLSDSKANLMPSLSNLHVYPPFLSKESSSMTSSSTSSPLHLNLHSLHTPSFSNHPTSNDPQSLSSIHSSPTVSNYSSNYTSRSYSGSLPSPLSATLAPHFVSTPTPLSTLSNYAKFCQEIKNHPSPNMAPPMISPPHVETSFFPDTSTGPSLNHPSSSFILNHSDQDPLNLQISSTKISEERNEVSTRISDDTSDSFSSSRSTLGYSELQHLSPQFDFSHSTSSSSAFSSSSSFSENTFEALKDSNLLSSDHSPTFHQSSTEAPSTNQPISSDITLSSSLSSSPSSRPMPSTFNSKPPNPNTNSIFTQDFNWAAKSLVNHITDLVLVLSPNGIIAWVSPSSTQAVGFEPDEMAGHPLGEFLHPNYHPCAPKQLTHAVYANRYFESNIRFRRKDSTYIVLHVIGRVFQPTIYDPMTVPYGKPITTTVASSLHFLTSPSSSNSTHPDASGYVLVTCRQYPASKFSDMLDEMVDLQIENKQLRYKLSSAYASRKQDIPEYSVLHQYCHQTIDQPGSHSTETTTQGSSSPSSSTVESWQTQPLESSKNKDFSHPTHSKSEDPGSQKKPNKSSSSSSSTSISSSSSSHQLSLRSKDTLVSEKTSLNSRKRKKAMNKKDGIQERVCYDCGVTQSPEWRRGPTGANTLCNACGLRFAKRQRLGVAEPIRHDSNSSSLNAP